MTERLSDERLTELEALSETATPGPWSRTFGPREPSRVWASDDDAEPLAVLGGYVEGADSVADAEFIAAAREALPALLAEVREHRARVAADERDRAALGTTPGSVTDAGFDAISDWWVPGKSDAYATVLVPALVETITDAVYAATVQLLGVKR